MKFKEFLTKCEEIFEGFSGDGELQKSFFDRTAHWLPYHMRENNKIDKPRLYIQWSTGGMSGGNCWNAPPEYYSSDEGDKDLQILDKILQSISPDLNFLQYKDLCNTLVKTDSYSENEYYGNSTDYSSKEIDLRSLFDYLLNKAVLIIGLPGSGKTYLANTKYEPKCYVLIDDPSNNKSSSALMTYHLNDTSRNLVITDPHLCNTKNRNKSVEFIKSKGYEVECVFFENDEEKCKKLLKERNDGRVIKSFKSFGYKIPDDVIPLKIYEHGKN